MKKSDWPCPKSQPSLRFPRFLQKGREGKAHRISEKGRHGKQEMIDPFRENILGFLRMRHALDVFLHFLYDSLVNNMYDY
jgi:hypothetical protein